MPRPMSNTISNSNPDIDLPSELLNSAPARSRFDHLCSRLSSCRLRSVALTKTLTAEDQVVQASAEASPIKWHLAHTTWFFEAFILKPFLPAYSVFSEHFDFCFNSYYESLGERLARERRGLLTRPTLEEVHQYRVHVDAALMRLNDGLWESDCRLQALIEIGIAHEEQHQELMLTDILALFALQPLLPAYAVGVDESRAESSSTSSLRAGPECRETSSEMLDFAEGIVKTGHTDTHSFAFDNESPEHTTLLHPFRIASELVTNAQWLEFVNDDGYRQASLWLSEGWQWAQSNRICAPGYWSWTEEGWHQMTLLGSLPVRGDAPVCHVSFYEADAFAKWSAKRLPTEFEWEHAVKQSGVEVQPRAHLAQNLIPTAVEAAQGGKLNQAFGEVWQWTSSAYLPYPGYRAPSTALGEYNGKFMCSQMVLRGSSFATAAGHSRSTYRNFFYPHQRWQFTGLRLAEDAS